jgi:hypothetical protein
MIQGLTYLNLRGGTFRSLGFGTLDNWNVTIVSRVLSRLVGIKFGKRSFILL